MKGNVEKKEKKSAGKETEGKKERNGSKMKAGEIKEKERQHIPSAWKREQDTRKAKSISSAELALSPFITPPLTPQNARQSK